MKRLTLLATDIVVLYCSLAAVLLLRYSTASWMEQWDSHVGPFSAIFLVWLLSFYIANLYEERILRNSRDFYGRLGQAAVVAGIISALFFYLVPSFGITPKTNLFIFIVISAALIVGARTLANKVLAAGTKKRVLMVGINTESVELARFITGNPQLGWAVSAFVRLGQEELQMAENSLQWKILDENVDLSKFIQEKHIDTVIISPQAYIRADLVAMLYGAMAQQVDFSSLASFSERLTGTLPLGALSQQWFLDNIAGNSKRPYEAAKRVIDVASAVLLGVPTLVITPLIALLIRINSRGPIFFRQIRTGRGGKPFEILKFRTMHTDAEKNTGAVWAQEKDPRTTGIGRFLRKTRIDELPQLWNILKGDMSLVGPRAERPEFDLRLGAEVPFYRERYLIKPGLSGWAQINYPYGASVQDSMRKLEYDLYYLKHRSLALDLEIILKTANISLRRAGR
jgi:exopolysaccharide biosynthesis polyprenyl glycosylphosphotransferase